MKPLLLLWVLALAPKLFAQSYPALDKALKRELPVNSMEDGRWVYYPDKANIEKIEKPLVKAVFPNYDFYKLTLTNHLGYHVNQGTCTVLFDSLKSKIVLVEPLWYSGISEPLVRLFLKKQFNSLEQLTGFLKEVHELMEIGSGYKFINTGTTEQVISYDLVYFKGDSYTNGSSISTSTIQYNQDGVWRQIEIHLKDLRPMEYVSINPALKDQKEYKNSYKQTIK